MNNSGKEKILECSVDAPMGTMTSFIRW